MAAGGGARIFESQLCPCSIGMPRHLPTTPGIPQQPCPSRGCVGGGRSLPTGGAVAGRDIALRCPGGCAAAPAVRPYHGKGSTDRISRMGRGLVMVPKIKTLSILFILSILSKPTRRNLSCFSMQRGDSSASRRSGVWTYPGTLWRTLDLTLCRFRDEPKTGSGSIRGKTIRAASRVGHRPSASQLRTSLSPLVPNRRSVRQSVR
jgi:hypothetical protein